MKHSSLRVVVSLAGAVSTCAAPPGAEPPPAARSPEPPPPPAQPPAPEPAPEPLVVATPEPPPPAAPERAPTRVVPIPPWSLEITLPESAGHVFDPANEWFHAEIGWEQVLYLRYNKGPLKPQLSEIRREWKLGRRMELLAEEVLPDGSVFMAATFEVAVPSNGKAMLTRVTRIHVLHPIDARSHVDCSISIEHVPGPDVLAASRDLCLSVRRAPPAP